MSSLIPAEMFLFVPVYVAAFDHRENPDMSLSQLIKGHSYQVLVPQNASVPKVDIRIDCSQGKTSNFVYLVYPSNFELDYWEIDRWRLKNSDFKTYRFGNFEDSNGVLRTQMTAVVSDMGYRNPTLRVSATFNSWKF